MAKSRREVRGHDILIPNSLIPTQSDNLRTAIGEPHRRYSRMINFREEWRGYLMIHSWPEFIQSCVSEDEMESLRKHERTGRPLGDEHFIDQIESKTGLTLQKKKTGPKGQEEKL